MARAPARPKPAAKRTASRRAAIDPGQYPGSKKASMPAFIDPALATLVKKPPVGAAWIHEVKFDGYRLQVRVDAGRVKLLTRSGLDWTERFGDRLAAALLALPAKQIILDGEVVVEDEQGRSSFSMLQAALKEGRTSAMLYYAFDLLYLDGHDLRALSLSRRRALLDQLLLGRSDPIRFSEAFSDPGASVLQHACKFELEGIVSKSCDHPYRSGRQGIWVKSKCSSRQEFVVAGYVPSTASKIAIGSLVLGVYESGKLRHVGRVGTGFTHKMAQDLYRRLEERRADRSPFSARLDRAAAKDARFVRPDLVAEVDFRGWSSDGLLRHASFKGIREDKAPAEIGVEEPVDPPSAAGSGRAATAAVTASASRSSKKARARN